jgi:hypothetical protein
MTVILPVRLGDRPRWATIDAIWTMAENLSDRWIGGAAAEPGPQGRYPRGTATKPARRVAWSRKANLMMRTVWPVASSASSTNRVIAWTP